MSKNNKELLFSVTKKDFRIDTFRSGGKGGQHQNTTDSGVRITHIESGAVGESRSERSQPQNKKLAFKRLLNSTKWKIWFNKKCYEETQKESIEERVEKQMNPSNIKVEIRDESGKWVCETD